MRWRVVIAVLGSVLLLALVLYERRAAQEIALSSDQRSATTSAAHPGSPRVFELFSSKTNASGSHRLSNTHRTLDELTRVETAILLENAMVDTALPLPLEIPEGLRAQGEPGAYIVQSRGPLNEEFRTLIARAGGSIISYIPNNAYLVQASSETARRLRTDSRSQSVLAYEPYFKLKGGLLRMASKGEFPREGGALKLLLFPGTRAAALARLEGLGVRVSGEERSPFGPVLTVAPSGVGLAELAGLAEVQEIERARGRVPANDLSRGSLGVSVDSTASTNYLGLTGGTNVLVNINDTGVDTNHPDLQGRVLLDAGTNLPAGQDPSGHGTHVAGIIAGNGSKSLTVTGAGGSVLPPRAGQFRGKAPGARLFAMSLQAPDTYLQETAARTNAFISNNSWNYDDNEYDLAAASYDAAVRDALPATAGSQPLLYVFPAGNAGALNREVVLPGLPAPRAADTILSPGTAKNVITVGAVEQPRQITNQVILSTPGGDLVISPWESSTDSGAEVADFSALGNVGVGIESESGRFKPDVVAPGTFVVSTRSTTWDQAAYYNPLLQPPGNALTVLSNLNEGIGPFYRFESGCSMAAAAVSGTLALMQEFFQERLGQTNSPALMKALLINGARSLGTRYSFPTGATTNQQGWGLINLTNTLPVALSNPASSASSMLLFDQSPSRSLATGREQVFRIRVASAARNLPLRITLAWTDPPANPIAGTKLVNDLDLAVTNLTSGQVFFGNDIAPGGVFNRPWDLSSAPPRDCVNNVENVYLAPPLGDTYVVAVIGRRVNVTTVSAPSAATAQDYALVLSSGNGEVSSALSLQDYEAEPGSPPPVVAITNMFDPGGVDFGGVLLRQRVGADSPLLATNTILLPSTNGQVAFGGTAQWRFYTVTNINGFTNAAFLTFRAKPLALASPGLLTPSNIAASAEADIDLYVSQDFGLTNLQAASLAAAAKSLDRGGTEAIVLSNAQAGVYYLGVKCERQQGAEFGIAAGFSDEPFYQADVNNNLVLRGFPASAPIPDGLAWSQPEALVFAVTDQCVPIHRVIVTNVLTHPSGADLVGTLAHDGVSVVLNNRNPPAALDNWSRVFDDSLEMDVPGATHSDGPGSLHDFVGRQGRGLWILSQADVVPGNRGTNNQFGLFLESEPDLATGINAMLLPGASREDPLFIPFQTTNLAVLVEMASGHGPLSVELCPAVDDNECIMQTATPASPTVHLMVDHTTDPPLHPGMYIIRSRNLGAEAATMSVTAKLQVSADEPRSKVFRMASPVPLTDDGLTSSVLYVTNNQRIVSLNVGVGIEHPRISDLAISLVSPAGTRVLLAQNRGAFSQGLGLVVLVTNVTPESSSGGPEASTNVVDTGQTSGTVTIDYYFYQKPDDLRVYYENQRIFDSGMVSYSGTWRIPYGPGSSTELTVVMNEGGNYDPATAWDYTLTSTRFDFLLAQFTENTNLTSTPMKFAVPPFTNAVLAGPAPGTNAIFFLPEESLDAFRGERAGGQWRLEIADTRAGAMFPTPILVGWQLSFLVDSGVPVPLPLTHGLPQTQTVRAGHLRFFEVDVPPWARYSTNRLMVSSAPVDLWFNAGALPFGTNGPGDVRLLSGSLEGSALASSGPAPPAFVPGGSYFLAVQNTNAAPVSFTLEMDFDVPGLVNGTPFDLALGPGAWRSFWFDVSTDSVAASVQLFNLTANGDLVVRYGPPLPDLTGYDYASLSSDTNAESVSIDTNSTPVALAPGRWYVSVFNRDFTNLLGTLLFTERSTFEIVITDYQVVGDSLCVTWTSFPGQAYQVQGRNDLLPPSQWITLSPMVFATGFSSSTCIPFISGLSYFRVVQAPAPPDSAFMFAGIEYSWAGNRLRWFASTGNTFLVQWKTDLPGAEWNDFKTPVASTTGEFEFIDDGSESNGFGQTRFYRLVRLP